MMVDGGQITMCWHMANLKIFHRDKATVSEFMMALVNEFGRDIDNRHDQVPVEHN